MNLVEAVAELDEDLMMKYLEGEELTVEEIKAGIQKCYYRMLKLFLYLWFLI